MRKPTVKVNHVTTTNQSIAAKHFFNTAFKTFSLYDNVRSIPTLVDGFKPSQRKAICGTLARGENAGEMQVERLASMIAAHTDYHHGANSLVSTIVGMANDKMPGMNNMNMFVPEGQFGSRLTNEAGAGRYIFTYLHSNFRKLFKKEDDCILRPIVVDGMEIEPHYYIPLLPIALINGASGTGTGHGTEIFSYHPEHVRDATLKVVEGKKLVGGKLTPWYRGYHGEVKRIAPVQPGQPGQVISTGKLEVVNSTTILITELPIGMYLDKYKTILNALEEAEFIKQYDDDSSEEMFKFTVTVPRSTSVLPMATLLQKFKLIGKGTENYTLWNANNILQKYESAEAIIEAFVPWRLEQYGLRREKLMSETAENIRYLSEVIRFIRFYLANTKTFKDTSKKELVELLLEKKFIDYDKLLSMPIWNLTKDKIAELENKLDDRKVYLAKLEADTPIEMYKRELKEFKYVE